MTFFKLQLTELYDQLTWKVTVVIDLYKSKCSGDQIRTLKELRYKNGTRTSHGSSWCTWHDYSSAEPSWCKSPCICRIRLLSPYPYQRAVVASSTLQFFSGQLYPCFVLYPSILCPPSFPPVVVKKDILQLKRKFPIVRKILSLLLIYYHHQVSVPKSWWDKFN